ncbi:MAG: DsbA family oxidoreductase [Nitrospirales bacterium]|nr:DsbA family oxidoreductase [Nitrospirales bacterium]
MTRSVRITVWSDYVCPFCYLEEPVLDRIRREYDERVELEWRAFELRPAPVPTLDPKGEYLRTVWNQAVYPMARERSMTLRLPPVQPRSRRALELAEFARARGRFDDVHRGLFKAFFEDGRDIDDLETLIMIGTAAGLDGEAMRSTLEQGIYRERVIQDEREAADLGIRAVPTMVVSRVNRPLQEAEVMSGAQPYEVVRAAVERAKPSG